VRKISPPPGFDPRTVQPVVSRYTDGAIRLTQSLISVYKNILQTGGPELYCPAVSRS
jgi:hypothetical protein